MMLKYGRNRWKGVVGICGLCVHVCDLCTCATCARVCEGGCHRQMSNAHDTHLSSFSALVSFFPEALSSATTSLDTAASRFSEILGGRRVNTC